MSYERDRNRQPATQSKDRASPSIAPGRVTLTDKLSKQMAERKPPVSGNPGASATSAQQPAGARSPAAKPVFRDFGGVRDVGVMHADAHDDVAGVPSGVGRVE